MGRIELPTSPLPRECSTPELHGPNCIVLYGAGEGNRTLTVSLEGFCSTIELHPHLLFSAPIFRLDFGGGRRIRTFEAFATDLQSAPFGRSGIPPKEKRNIRDFPQTRQALLLIFLHYFFKVIIFQCFYFSAVMRIYLACSSSSVSGCSSSIKMQSTGHTCWHCGSS